MPTDNPTVYYTRVQNQSLPKQQFDTLCDHLSQTRHWCSDYRLVRDFDKHNEHPYWVSNSHYAKDTDIIQAEFESVSEDVDRFLRAISAAKDSVTVETKSTTLS